MLASRDCSAGPGPARSPGVAGPGPGGSLGPGPGQVRGAEPAVQVRGQGAVPHERAHLRQQPLPHGPGLHQDLGTRWIVPVGQKHASLASPLHPGRIREGHVGQGHGSAGGQHPPPDRLGPETGRREPRLPGKGIREAWEVEPVDAVLPRQSPGEERGQLGRGLQVGALGPRGREHAALGQLRQEGEPALGDQTSGDPVGGAVQHHPDHARCGPGPERHAAPRHGQEAPVSGCGRVRAL